MVSSDAAFAGSIPDIYDRFLGPALFDPFAADLAERFMGFEGKLLETAAGTGRVTRALAAAAPKAQITATDLNEAMIAKAQALTAAPNVAWRQADAQALPFVDAGFDAVVCQFGVMFFPDKAAGYHQARRVLRRGGRYVFNVWDGLAANDLTRVVQETLVALFPRDPPGFILRAPHGYHDAPVIQAGLIEAGFSKVDIEGVDKTVRSESGRAFATGFCTGSPLLAELQARRPDDVESVVASVGDALAERFGPGPIEGRGRAYVVTARA